VQLLGAARPGGSARRRVVEHRTHRRRAFRRRHRPPRHRGKDFRRRRRPPPLRGRCAAAVGRVIDTVEDWDRAVKAFEVAGMPVQAPWQAEPWAGQAYRGELAAARRTWWPPGRVFPPWRGHPGAECYTTGVRGRSPGDLPGVALFDRAQNRSLSSVRCGPRCWWTGSSLLRAGSALRAALAEAAVRALEEAGCPDVPEACLLAARAANRTGPRPRRNGRVAPLLFPGPTSPSLAAVGAVLGRAAEAAARRPGVG